MRGFLTFLQRFEKIEQRRAKKPEEDSKNPKKYSIIQTYEQARPNPESGFFDENGQILGVSQPSAWRILREDLSLKPFKFKKR